MKQQTNFKDIWFTVVYEQHEYRCDFTIYEICSTEPSIQWHRKGGGARPDCVDTLDEAQVFAHGEVKWDGCSNWYFDEQDNCMIHRCSKEGAVRIGEMLGRCYDLAVHE